MTTALTAAPKPPAVDKNTFTVVLDPGHGGIDPGAQRAGLDEKDLMLSFARDLRDVTDHRATIFNSRV